MSNTFLTSVCIEFLFCLSVIVVVHRFNYVSPRKQVISSKVHTNLERDEKKELRMTTDLFGNCLESLGVYLWLFLISTCKLIHTCEWQLKVKQSKKNRTKIKTIKATQVSINHHQQRMTLATLEKVSLCSRRTVTPLKCVEQKIINVIAICRKNHLIHIRWSFFFRCFLLIIITKRKEQQNVHWSEETLHDVYNESVVCCCDKMKVNNKSNRNKKSAVIAFNSNCRRMR